MRKNIRFIGLDVHKATIVAARAEGDSEPQLLGTIANDEASIRRLFREQLKSAGKARLKVAYEAGPCGFALYRLLVSMGIDCDVIAPSLIPKKAGDRVKTDRRDALNLARCARNGDLTPVRVPTELEEAFRDLVRAREGALGVQLRARHRLEKFLLRHDVRAPAKAKSWNTAYMKWLKSVRFDDIALQATLEDARAEVDHQTDRVTRFNKEIERNIARLDEVMRETIVALQALRGVKQLTAATIAIEMGPVARFASPRQLMSYVGNVPSEYSSGEKQTRGRITKTGNAHLRRVLGEAAWTYTRAIRPGVELQRRRACTSPEIAAIAQKAEKRLNGRFFALAFKGKHRNKAATAVARELLGFIWAIGMHVHLQHEQRQLKKSA